MATVAVVSFRLGLPDGVSVVAETWVQALREIGFTVTTVAGEGTADRLLPGLALGAATPPPPGALADALRDADLVVVENVLTFPGNLAVSLHVAEVLRGRPAVLHHHDPPWQRTRFEHVTELPADDPAWRHVTINRLTEGELAVRGLVARTIYNCMPIADPGDGTRLRTQLAPGRRPLLLHPVRAIERKNVPAALALAEAVGGLYWLPGRAEEGYGPTVDRLLAGATVPVSRRPLDHAEMPDAYAACDAVLYPSTWEGFGLPPLEAAVHHRPIVVGDYPVAAELRAVGFRWLPADDPSALEAALADPASLDEDLAVNRELVETHFSPGGLRATLADLLADAGWLP